MKLVKTTEDYQKLAFLQQLKSRQNWKCIGKANKCYFSKRKTKYFYPFGLFYSKSLGITILNNCTVPATFHDPHLFQLTFIGQFSAYLMVSMKNEENGIFLACGAKTS